MDFTNLGLQVSLLKAIQEQGYDRPTPIQEKVIPLVIDGRDVLAVAQTGTGKTAGFTLPILERLSYTQSEMKKRQIRVLVLTPTRELATQISESIKTYGKYMPYTSTVIFGGVGINPQLATLRKKVDIVIATPGRLLDIVAQEGIDFSTLECLVLDEADRMLDMGFLPSIKKLMTSMPKKKQTLLFSATFIKEIKTLASGLLDNPAFIEVAKQSSTNTDISQIVHLVDKSRKRELLAQLIKVKRWKQVLVFTCTKHSANVLVKQLQEYSGIQAVAIHGNKSQGARTKALNDFKEGRVRVLVATDIVARGIDIDKLPHVVNYELPNIPEDYVHRIGRTGRAGVEGQAISLVCSEEHGFLKEIEKCIQYTIPQVKIEAFKPEASIKHVLEDNPTPTDQKISRKQHRKARESPTNMAAKIGSALQAKLDKLDKKTKPHNKRKK